MSVCVLSYKIYCAYTPSNGAMALLNKISVSIFRTRREGRGRGGGGGGGWKVGGGENGGARGDG